ncbi:hypothetical protein MAP44135_3171 [Mycobacterium avium subsp. paratuberculosis]|nr:hypothetical protein MAP44135_3171 [Mycobacterium avium subsp. paratuberculosis]CAG6985824.1 hypothetical protein PICSAR141_02227 [Mycobacterium avium subsp. paratuberculosis]
MGFAEQVRDGFGLQPLGPAGPSPDQRRRRRGRVHAGAGRQLGQHAEQQPPVQRGGRGVQGVGERPVGFAVRPATADQGRPAGQVEPAASQQLPALGGRQRGEAVGGRRRRPVRRLAGGRFGVGHSAGDQPCRGRHFQDQAQPLLVNAGRLAEPLDLANPEPTAAQLGNRCRGQCFQQHVELAQQVDDRAGGRRVGVLGRRGRHHRVGRTQLQGAGLLAAQHLPHVAGQDHRLGVEAPQQPHGQQLGHRPVGGCARRSIAGAAHRGALEKFLQHVELRRVEVIDQRRDLLGAARGVLEDDLARMPRHAAARVRGDLQRAVAPHQDALPQVVERVEDLGFGGALADQRQQLGGGHRLDVGLQHEQRVEHRQPQEVEVVGGGLDRLAGLGSRGQCGDAAGRQLGQVRPQFQQSDQPLVGQLGQPRPQRDTGGVVGHC